MSRITIVENEFASLWYYPEAKIVHHKINKFIFGQPLQDLLNKGTETLKKYGANKWLSDDRNNNALPVKDSEWANTVWFPETAKAGWKYWALVQPEKNAGKLNMKRQASITSQGGVTVQLFDNPEDAMKWLESL